VALDITNKEFLKVIFQDQYPEVHVTAITDDPTTGSISQWRGWKFKATWGRLDWSQSNSFYTVSTFSGDRRVDAAAEQLWVLVVDDVGPNGKATQADWNAGLSRRMGRDIEPTYVLETSPGNFHYGYAVAGLDTHAKASLAMSWWMDLVLEVFGKDPGNAGLTRYVRMPQGINNKAKLGKVWKHKLHIWNPKFRYKGEIFIKKLGATEEQWTEACDGGYPRGGKAMAGGASYDDPTQDPTGWGTALWNRGLIETAHKVGAWDMECPWIDGHSDRANSGSSYLGDGTFKCHHGSCEHRTPADWKDELEKLYPGITQEAAEAAWGSDPDPDGGLSDDEKDFLQEQNTQAQTEKAAMAAAFDRFAWLPSGKGMFYDADLNMSMTQASFNLTFLPQREEFAEKAGLWSPNDKTKNGSVRVAPAAAASVRQVCRVASGVEYGPGLQPLFPHYVTPGAWVANTWRDVDLKGVVDDTAWDLFMTLVERVAGDDKSDLMLDWLAMVVGEPSEKPGWQWLVASSPGLGKDTLGTIMSSVVGTENSQTINGPDLGAKWTEWAAKKLVVVSELVSQDHAGRRGGASAYDRIKMFLANMPKRITVEEKWGLRYQVRNVGAFLMFTNHDFPLLVEEGERRLCVVDRRGQPKWDMWQDIQADVVRNPDAWFTIRWRLLERWSTLDEGRREVLRGEAPDTDAKRLMVEASGTPLEVFIDDLTTGEHVLITVDELRDRWRIARRHDGLGTGYRMTVAALKKAGGFHVYEKHPKGQVRGVGTVWAVREEGVVVKGNDLTEKDIRDLLSVRADGENVAVLTTPKSGGDGKSDDVDAAADAFADDDIPDNPLDFL
jgi:hypothetical protein